MLHWGTLPLYYAISAPNPSPVTFWDYLAFAFTIGAVIWEATADQQLMDFMVRKKTDKTLVRVSLEPSQPKLFFWLILSLF